jgi:hypothetical protein
MRSIVSEVLEVRIPKMEVLLRTSGLTLRPHKVLPFTQVLAVPSICRYLQDLSSLNPVSKFAFRLRSRLYASAYPASLNFRAGWRIHPTFCIIGGEHGH